MIEPRAGQIGLILRGKSPLAWAIRVITKSHANHVIIALDEATCIGAESSGATIHPISHFDNVNVVWSHFQLTSLQRKGIVRWARRHEGVPYAWWTDIAIGVYKILGSKAPKWLEDILASDGQYECAQLAQCAYLSVGRDVFDGKYRPGEVYPGSFEPIFVANGWV